MLVIFVLLALLIAFGIPMYLPDSGKKGFRRGVWLCLLVLSAGAAIYYGLTGNWAGMLVRLCLAGLFFHRWDKERNST